MAKDRQTKQVLIKNGMTMWNKLTKTMKMAIIFEQNKKMNLFFFFVISFILNIKYFQLFKNIIKDIEFAWEL